MACSDLFPFLHKVRVHFAVIFALPGEILVRHAATCLACVLHYIFGAADLELFVAEVLVVLPASHDVTIATATVAIRVNANNIIASIIAVMSHRTTGLSVESTAEKSKMLRIASLKRRRVCAGLVVVHIPVGIKPDIVFDVQVKGATIGKR